MSKNTDKEIILTTDEIVLGSFESYISSLAEESVSRSSIQEHYHVEPYIEYLKSVKEDSEVQGVDFDESQAEADYQSWQEESAEGLAEDMQEFDAEMAYIRQLNPATFSKECESGTLQFAMCQYDTEGVNPSIWPYEWRCTLRSPSGEVLSFIYGTLYVASEDGFSNINDVPFIADNHTAQEIKIVSQYFRHVGQKDPTLLNDPYRSGMVQAGELVDLGPIIFIQYMKRNLSRGDLKGLGFESLKFSIESILAHLGAESFSVCCFVDMYKKRDASYAKTVSKKLRTRFEQFFYEEIDGCEQLDMLRYFEEL